MNEQNDGTSARLLRLCVGYFVFYVVTGVSVKYFLGKPALGFPGMTAIEYLVYSTIGGNLICVTVVVALRWIRLESTRTVRLVGREFPSELVYIIPSGVCTAVVIPTTTLMYTLPVSIMVAMVIMRGSVIVISRIVDGIQIAQGLLKKKVHAEENIAVVFAMIAVAVPIAYAKDGGFDFFHDKVAIAILGSYIAAYALRIYIMNYFKNTRPRVSPANNRGFFAIEQVAATVTALLATTAIVLAANAGLFGARAASLRDAFVTPPALWPWAIVSGLAFGCVAFFSVFIFMFEGRTATFAGLVNRLTSLVAGTIATLSFGAFFGGAFPGSTDWISLAFISIAVAFLARAEGRRKLELARAT